jgi:hypothetical protein
MDITTTIPIIMDTLTTIKKQNEYLIGLVGTSLFLIGLFTGHITNYFVNILVIMCLMYDTFKANKNNSFNPLITLKKWMVYETIFVVEYFVLLVFNFYFVCVILNFLKLGFLILNNIRLGKMYDIYFEKWFDQLEMFIMPSEDVNSLKRDIGRKYDMLYHMTNVVNYGLSFMGSSEDKIKKND